MVQQTAPPVHLQLQLTATFCFLLLDQWFSLQSWCVLGSKGSVEGLVLPSSDGQEVSSWVCKDSIKTLNLLYRKRLIKVLLNEF